jgi:L-asparaginase II
MNVDQALQCGAEFTRKHLAVIEAAHGRDIAVAYAAGMSGEERNFIAARYGIRSAYDCYQGLADDLVACAAKESHK